MRWLLSVMLVAGCGKSASTPELGWIEVDPKQSLDATLARESAAALAAGKRPFAYLHADWCPPCVAIDKTRDDPRMQQAFAGTHIIAIDVDRVDNGKILAAGMDTKVLPIFFRLDHNGEPTGAKLDGGAWGDNVPETMAPPMTAFFAK